MTPTQQRAFALAAEAIRAHMEKAMHGLGRTAENYPAFKKAFDALNEADEEARKPRPQRLDICTKSGNYFNFEKPEDSVFFIDDIAHALSHICRFTGHVRTFYSVAQHCVLASYHVPRQYALQALLHDAAEAFVGDVAKPLKNMLSQYSVIEERVERAVLARFGLTLPLHPCIKEIDLVLLATERRDLMPRLGDTWRMLDGVKPLPAPIRPWKPFYAKVKFLDRYYELTNGN